MANVRRQDAFCSAIKSGLRKLTSDTPGSVQHEENVDVATAERSLRELEYLISKLQSMPPPQLQRLDARIDTPATACLAVFASPPEVGWCAYRRAPHRTEFFNPPDEDCGSFALIEI
jgi:hypothetical protein